MTQHGQTDHAVMTVRSELPTAPLMGRLPRQCGRRMFFFYVPLWGIPWSPSAAVHILDVVTDPQVGDGPIAKSLSERRPDLIGLSRSTLSSHRWMPTVMFWDPAPTVLSIFIASVSSALLSPARRLSRIATQAELSSDYQEFSDCRLAAFHRCAQIVLAAFPSHCL